MLFSHGVTPPSEAVFNRLQDLHPQLKQEIPVIEIKEDQFSITADNAKKSLFRHCSETWKSLDPFGWSTALLHLVRGITSEEGPSFFDLCADFISKLANCDVPDTVAFVFTTGSLVALNKDADDIRRKRVEDGLRPRERPINQGTMFLKLAFDLALRSRQAQDAVKELLPIQQGVGAPRGMELISHACSSFYKQGYAVLKMDATNGFQELQRAKMHRAVERRCPSLMSLFQKYYYHDSIGLYNTGEAIKVVKIEEGCRMGCKLSSFGFSLTVQDAYLNVKEQLERTALDKSTDHSFLKAATDDVIIVIKSDPANPAALYKRVRGLCTKLNLEAERVGLSFDNDKAQLLLPQGWSAPADPLALPTRLDVKFDTAAEVRGQGMEIVGSPIGSELFCKNFIRTTLKSMVQHNKDLAQVHPQAASKLLLKCVSTAPGYLTQVCHPSMTKEPLKVFDKELWKLWTCILGGVGHRDEQLTMCATGQARSRQWTYLPSREGGVGLRHWETIADYAWYCSFAECTALQDVNFDIGRMFAKKECEQAHAIALTALGGVTYVNQADFEILPPEEPDVLFNSDYYKNWQTDHKHTKLQKEFNGFLGRRQLKLLTSHSELTQAHVTKSELIRSLQARQKPGASVLKQLFSANLSDRDTRLTPTEFILSARQFIVLPALKIPRGEIVELKCGCEAQKCPNAACGGTVIDPSGNHALLCHPGIAARKATLLERGLERVFRKAGGRASRQPTTFRLLGEVVPKDDLAALFPGGLNLEETKKNADLAIELVDAFLLPGSALKDSVIEEIRGRLPAVDEDKKEANANIIRFDLCLAASFPVDSPRELWLDHAIVHETSDSYQEAVIAHVETTELTTSLPFRRMETSKKRRFAALIPLANYLVKQNVLDFQPFFLFPVMSALGYLNEDAQKMTKWMSAVLNKTLASSVRDDAIPLSVIKARYKVEVNNAICFGLLRGNALAMNSVGRSHVNRPL